MITHDANSALPAYRKVRLARQHARRSASFISRSMRANPLIRLRCDRGGGIVMLEIATVYSFRTEYSSKIPGGGGRATGTETDAGLIAGGFGFSVTKRRLLTLPTCAKGFGKTRVAAESWVCRALVLPRSSSGPRALVVALCVPMSANGTNSRFFGALASESDNFPVGRFAGMTLRGAFGFGLSGSFEGSGAFGALCEGGAATGKLLMGGWGISRTLFPAFCGCTSIFFFGSLFSFSLIGVAGLLGCLCGGPGTVTPELASGGRCKDVSAGFTRFERTLEGAAGGTMVCLERYASNFSMRAAFFSLEYPVSLYSRHNAVS